MSHCTSSLRLTQSTLSPPSLQHLHVCIDELSLDCTRRTPHYASTLLCALQVGEVVLEWDADGSGTIDKQEFRHQVIHTLGFKVTDEELDELFHVTFDPEGNGGDASIDEVMMRRASSIAAMPYTLHP